MVKRDLFLVLCWTRKNNVNKIADPDSESSRILFIKEYKHFYERQNVQYEIKI